VAIGIVSSSGPLIISITKWCEHNSRIVNVVLSADDAYKSTDSEFLESDSTQNQCGSTASTAVLVGDRLFVANVGDSRAVISRGGSGNQHFTVPAFTHLVAFS
jgi:serine/threonine protein phosphatase PrpC